MKLITINVSDEEHKEIKLKATEAGLSIKGYLLSRPKTSAPFYKGRPVKRGKFAGGELRLPETKEVKLCKHGNPKGQCFHKEAVRLKCNST